MNKTEILFEINGEKGTQIIKYVYLYVRGLLLTISSHVLLARSNIENLFAITRVQ